MTDLFAREPALLIAGAGAVAEALLLTLIAFGLPITPDQKLALQALGTVILTVATGIATRSQVTPVAMLPLAALPPKG
jgi:hypothetical protein